jgi:5-bromo-4-chloroindolyl phosphate hydrolysis protein
MNKGSLSRELMAGIAGGAVFILFLFILQLSIWPSLAAGIGTYVAVTLIFSPTRIFGIELGRLAGINPQTFKETMGEGFAILERMEHYGERIANTTAKQSVARLCESTRRILEEVRKKPSNIKTIRTFFNSYLKRTEAIIRYYVEMSEQNLELTEVRKQLRDVEAMLSSIEQAFEIQRKKLMENDMFDLVIEMKVLGKQLESEREIGQDLLKEKGGTAS